MNNDIVSELSFFVLLAKLGSLSATARELGITPPAITKRLMLMEQRLGVRLLNRTTRRISVTEAGQTFYRHCVAVVAEAQAARDAIDRTRSTPQGLVRLSCPLSLLQGGVNRVVSDYLAAYPLVRIAIDATNRRVDVIEEGIDLALRVRPPPLEDSDLAVRVLSKSEPMLVASPRLFDHYPRPSSVDELSRLPTLAMVRAGDKYLWNLVALDGRQIDVSHTPRMVTDDMPTLRLAALAGLGVTELPRDQVQPELDFGLLEPVMPEFGSIVKLVHVVFPSRRGLVPAVRGLLDALVQGYENKCCLA